MAAATSALLVRLTWSGEWLATVQEKLQSDTRVSEVKLAAGAGTFRFRGEERELAPVLALLVAANVPVTSFGAVKQTVEELYMKLSTHEVM